MLEYLMITEQQAMENIILTERLLEQLDACESGIDFAKRNKLFGFPLNRLYEVENDYDDFVSWLMDNTVSIKVSNGNLVYNENIDGFEVHYEYDQNDNMIHSTTYPSNQEVWNEYDKNGNLIHSKNSHGTETWSEYDKNGNLIHYKNSHGLEKIMQYNKNNNLIYRETMKHNKEWYDYDGDNNLIHYKQSNRKNEIWYKHDSRGNIVHIKKLGDFEEFMNYDENNNMTHYMNTNGFSTTTDIEYYDDGQLKRFDDLMIPYFNK